MQELTAEQRAILAATVAGDKLAHDIVVFDVGDIISITDFFVVVTATNTRQGRTVVDEVERVLKEKAGLAPRSVEGLEDASWVLLDYGDFVVHVFQPDTRAYYDLDRLWSDATRVEWEGRDVAVS